MSPERWREVFDQHFSPVSGWADWDLWGVRGAGARLTSSPCYPARKRRHMRGREPRQWTRRCSLCLCPLSPGPGVAGSFSAFALAVAVTSSDWPFSVTQLKAPAFLSSITCPSIALCCLLPGTYPDLKAPFRFTYVFFIVLSLSPPQFLEGGDLFAFLLLFLAPGAVTARRAQVIRAEEVNALISSFHSPLLVPLLSRPLCGRR